MSVAFSAAIELVSNYHVFLFWRHCRSPDPEVSCARQIDRSFPEQECLKMPKFSRSCLLWFYGIAFNMLLIRPNEKKGKKMSQISASCSAFFCETTNHHSRENWSLRGLACVLRLSEQSLIRLRDSLQVDFLSIEFHQLEKQVCFV